MSTNSLPRERTRRANGEGTIYQDAKGTWHAYVSMGAKDNGKPDRRHVQGKRRSVVAAKVAELNKQRAAGNPVAAGNKYTAGEWLTFWLENIAARKVRPTTMNAYRPLTMRYLVPLLGAHRLDRLRPEHVEAFHKKMEDAGLSASTRLQAHRILSRALTVAMQRGYVGRNVATLVDAPSVERQEIHPLTPVEARRVLDAAKAMRNSARWSVALALGLRQGESLGLRWPNVDLEAWTISPEKQLQRSRARHGCGEQPAAGNPWPCGKVQPIRCPKAVGGGLVLVDLKSRAGERTIVLPLQLAQSLRDHRYAQDAERLAAGSEWHDLGFVFCQPNGKPIDPRQDWQTWKDLLKAAGVRDARLHDARHTAATLLLTQKVQARVAMEVLGHSQVSLTLGTYSHVAPELSWDAAERMGDALWG